MFIHSFIYSFYLQDEFHEAGTFENVVKLSRLEASPTARTTPPVRFRTISMSTTPALAAYLSALPPPEVEIGIVDDFTTLTKDNFHDSSLDNSEHENEGLAMNIKFVVSFAIIVTVKQCTVKAFPIFIPFIYYNS